MRHEIRLIPMFVLFASMAATSACGHTTAGEATLVQPPMQTSQNEKQVRVPGEYLVTLALGESEKIITERYARFGIKSIKALGNSTFLLIITKDIGTDGISKIVEKDTRFKAVQPNFIYKVN